MPFCLVRLNDFPYVTHRYHDGICPMCNRKVGRYLHGIHYEDEAMKPCVVFTCESCASLMGFFKRLNDRLLMPKLWVSSIPKEGK
jgi:hypothetical protein